MEDDACELYEFVLIPSFGHNIMTHDKMDQTKARKIKEDAVSFMTKIAFE